MSNPPRDQDGNNLSKGWKEARLGQVDESTWKLRPGRSAGPCTKDGFCPTEQAEPLKWQKGPPDYPGRRRKQATSPSFPLVPRASPKPGERSQRGVEGFSPSYLHKTLWLSTRSHPSKAFPGGLRMSPGIYGCPETGRAPLEQRDREQSGQKTPFYIFLRLLPSCRAPPSIARPPAPSKTQKNKPSCRLLPPPPPHPQETFKCIRHIDCIKHDEFLRHELAGLPWLPLP